MAWSKVCHSDCLPALCAEVGISLCSLMAADVLSGRRRVPDLEFEYVGCARSRFANRLRDDPPPLVNYAGSHDLPLGHMTTGWCFLCDYTQI